MWVPTVFSRNWDRLVDGQIAEAVHARQIGSADQRGFSPHEHFTVDGTFVEACASHKSVRPEDDPSPPPSTGSPKNPDVNFRGETRSNATRQSVTDPDVAQNIHARKPTSAIERRTTRHAGYAISQVKRTWRKRRSAGVRRLAGYANCISAVSRSVGWRFDYTNAAYNLSRKCALLRLGSATRPHSQAAHMQRAKVLAQFRDLPPF